tara:strand:+ start:2148 stop:4220 length:2073 start_codon:yes stop_codon:yes gene_type:complete
MALQYSPKIVQDSLVMCLDASNNKSYPTDLSVKNGLLVWLDAADDTTFSYSSGTVVSQWRDKSGNNFHANQSTTAQQPSRNTINNSRKSVFFNAASRLDYMTISSGISLPTDTSIFIVYKPSAQIYEYAVLIDNYHGQGGNYGFVIQRVSTNAQFYYANAGDGAGFIDTAASPWTYTNNVIQLLSLNKASSTGTPYISGTAQTSRSVRAATAQYTTGLGIGSLGAANGRFYNGDMCEILIFNRSLSSTEMKQVHTYLGQKWGISNTDRSIVDLSNNNYNGSFGGAAGSQTVANMPDYDFYNKGAFKFNGTSDFIQYPSLLNLGNVFTINFWIKPTSNTRQTIVSNGYPYLANKGFFLTCPGNSSTDMFLSLGNDQKTVQSNTGAITTGVVQMVTAVANGAGGLMKLYVNGTEVSYALQQNADISLQYDSGIFVTGKRDTATADYLSSNLYALQIYNKALSAAEVLQNYEAQKSKFANTIVQQGLMLHLDAENPSSYAGAGTVWYDVSGNGYNAGMNNITPSNWVTYNGVKAFETNDTNNQNFTVGSFPFPQSGRTYEIWINSKSFSLGWQSWFDDGGGERVLFGTSTNTIHVYPSVEVSTNLVAGQWYQLLYTMVGGNGTAVVVYKDGQAIGSGTYGYVINSGTGILLILGDTGSEITSCYCSTVRVYNRVLSAAEVLQNYNATKGRFGL